MSLSFGSRLKHAWNVFMNRDPTAFIQNVGQSYYYRPDRSRFRGGNERSMTTSVYNRIALDTAAISIQHVRLDDNNRFLSVIDSDFNSCLNLEANTDQTGRAFIQDVVMSMLDEGCVAIVPVDTTFDPKITGSYDIQSMRVGKITDWYHAHVRVKVYNEKRGEKEEIVVPKSTVAIIENPLYAVINEPNSTMQRLIRKLNLLDVIDEQSSSGKMNLIIQPPYTIKTKTRKEQAKDRRHEEETKNKKSESSEDEETVADVFNTLTDKQKTVVYALIGQALEDKENGDDEKGEDNKMKHNVFESDNGTQQGTLCHSDMVNIINLAKTNSVGSLQDAIGIYMENNSLSHGFDDVDQLFPEYKDVRPGAPELLQRDQGWVSVVMQKAHKSPISRIRTRQIDARDLDGTAGLRGYGYDDEKRNKAKVAAGNVKLLKRTTDPQTVYRKDALHRDDIIDITDFDVVEYQYGIMRQNLNEEIATAIMIGDGRTDGDDNKISEDHIRSIWHDDDLYTIHAEVDFAKAKQDLQGTGTGVSFGENYIYAEAIITAALYSREKYKGTGTPDFYCTPHLLNIMLLARDMNGRRIYESKSDLEKALNVGEIYTAEQFEGKTRTTKTNEVKKLLGIFVNLADYQIGSTKGGEITKFNQFDIDFNQEKYLIETRISGALTRVYSAIALEEPVVEDDGD